MNTNKMNDLIDGLKHTDDYFDVDKFKLISKKIKDGNIYYVYQVVSYYNNIFYKYKVKEIAKNTILSPPRSVYSLPYDIKEMSKEVLNNKIKSLIENMKKEIIKICNKQIVQLDNNNDHKIKIKVINCKNKYNKFIYFDTYINSDRFMNYFFYFDFRYNKIYSACKKYEDNSDYFKKIKIEFNKGDELK